MRYYLLRDDVFNEDVVPNRWHLDRLQYANDHDFFEPYVELMEPGSWRINILQDGVETDFTINQGGLPVVSRKIYDALQDLPEIKEPYRHTILEPLIFGNRTVENDYFLMITEDQVDCVDEEKSTFEKFTEDDPVRPDLAGQYDTFINFVIDPKSVVGRNIFRIKGKVNSLIVSEEVRKRFEAVGATGASFESVMGDRQTIA